MTHFDTVTEKLNTLEYMVEPQARCMRDFIVKHDLSEILEIGFFKGKSSAYIAAMLEDRGKGHLTTIDRTEARKYDPAINDTLKAVGLSHRVTPIFARRSYTWELGKMIRQAPRPQFDLCYFDGGHTWDPTGFGFVLVDMVLRPGGWIIFDDLDWTVAASIAASPKRRRFYKQYSAEEREAPAVRLVFETIVPHLRYRNIHELNGWGFAQKP